jgi:fibronectin type 3 domain-containing protein
MIALLVTGCGSSGGNSDTTPPSNPSNLSATPGDKAATLDWDGVEADDLAGYNVYRSTSESFEADDKVASTLSATQFTDDGLSNGTDYFYIVTAEDGSGNESNSSNGVTVRPPFEEPLDPR